jgi:hypothetical protein
MFSVPHHVGLPLRHVIFEAKGKLLNEEDAMKVRGISLADDNSAHDELSLILPLLQKIILETMFM